jgi:hypothetical protein
MYEIEDKSGFTKYGNWDVREKSKLIFKGTFKEVLRYCCKDLGFSPDDFERAISGLVYNSHNVIHFDINGKLTATSYKPKKTG